eukprot:c6851_g1_i1.p1 GENE.c6851_g1_i1~~c6851_g1_i1.p1  ORF type:complete len:364 (-),score=74.01 c6851_g1_i1:22-1113(-)
MSDEASTLETGTPTTPPPITEKDIIFDIDFHPNQSVVACGLVTGAVSVYKYGLLPQDNFRICAFKFHKKACRALNFSVDAQYLYTCSSDKSVRSVDCNTATVAWSQTRAHADPINALKCLTEQIMSTGDDEGVVKIWDIRTNTPTKEFSENSDFISDMALSADQRMLIVTSGDGHLSVFDLRKGILEAMSDNIDDELLSIALVKGGQKVVCGSQGGVLNIFSYGDWGDVSDRMPGHPQSVDSIVALSDDVICTGSSDGIVRVVNIHPNKLLGVMGEHSDFPIEKIALSHDKALVASSSHDHMIKFWDANIYSEQGENAVTLNEDGSEEEMEDDESDSDEEGQHDAITAAQKNLAQRSNFFSDL